MDKMDKHILRILQTDSSLSMSEIAHKVGLSPSPCWKRINRLQNDGIIKRKIALLDGELLGFGLTAYVSIKTGEHSSDWLEEFSKTVTKMPEVMEFHRMAGDVDYMLKVVVSDIQAFDNFYKRLIGASSINEVTSRFSMETIKETTALPIQNLPLIEPTILISEPWHYTVGKLFKVAPHYPTRRQKHYFFESSFFKLFYSGYNFIRFPHQPANNIDHFCRNKVTLRCRQKGTMTPMD